MFERIRISLLVCCIVHITAAAFAQSERSLVRQGNRAYEKQQYADAEVNYRKALEMRRDLHEGIFNLGDALYRQGRYEEAAEQYRSVAGLLPEPRTRAQALHNLGNALLKAQKLTESIAAYKEALKHNPHDLDTKYNLEYAKRLLQQQQSQQQNQQQKNDKKEHSEQQQQEEQQRQNNQQEQQQSQRQEEQRKREQSHAEQRQQQISREDAERILEALKNEEQQIQKKLMKKVPARVKIEKDW
jgi:Ca-activated chloride channel family protein